MATNIGEVLTRRARRTPDKEGLVEPATGRRLTYRELNARANQVANGLDDLGLESGFRVGLLLMNGTEFVESFFGAGKVGGVAVPLNWRLVADELEFILSDAGVTALIFGVEFAEVAAELRSRGDKTPIAHWIQVGGEADAATADVVAYDDWIGGQSADEPEIRGRGDDLMFIMYTSGTTGLPKGVMHSHNTVEAAMNTVLVSADFRMGDRFLNSLPLFHVGALNPVLCNIYAGCALVILRTFDPTESWQQIKEEQISTTLMVPAMLQFMLLVHNPDEHDASTLRWVMSGAAPVPVELIKAYDALNIEIHQVYGLTETCGPACLLDGVDAMSHAGSTGKAFFHTDVRVVRPDGSDCEPGEAGEVLVRGPHVMIGYWNRPEATAETLVDGWLHTGDVATMDADGYVTIVDRIKDMLISGGENVYPAEIENVLLGHEGVADAGVIGIPSKKWGESPLAVIVKKDADLTAESVLEHCRGKLAPFKTVKAVEFVETIPRNPSGKILKRELREMFPADAPE